MFFHGWLSCVRWQDHSGEGLEGGHDRGRHVRHLPSVRGHQQDIQAAALRLRRVHGQGFLLRRHRGREEEGRLRVQDSHAHSWLVCLSSVREETKQDEKGSSLSPA